MLQIVRYSQYIEIKKVTKSHYTQEVYFDLYNHNCDILIYKLKLCDINSNINIYQL